MYDFGSEKEEGAFAGTPRWSLTRNFTVHVQLCGVHISTHGVLRRSIFDVHLKGIKSDLDKSILAKKMAAQTPGFAGMYVI